MSLNQPLIENPALAWFGEPGDGSGMDCISRPVNRRQSGIRLAMRRRIQTAVAIDPRWMGQ